MHRLFDIVSTTVTGLRRRGLARGFFFLRKPPGLRLRFALARGAGREAARGEIAAALDAAVADGAARSWFASVYEPEAFKLGGPAAMPAVHDYFIAHTRSWWRWQRLRDDGPVRVGDAVLSLAVLNDLFARFLDGPEEIWDVWRHIALLHGEPAPAPRAGVPPIRPAHLVGRLTPRQRALLRGCEIANQRLAAAYRRLHARGALLHAYRMALPHIALAHWNREGLSLEDRRTIFSAMTTAWAPSVDAAAATKGE